MLQGGSRTEGGLRAKSSSALWGIGRLHTGRLHPQKHIKHISLGFVVRSACGIVPPVGTLRYGSRYRGCVAAPKGQNPREKSTTVTFHNYAICRVPHDHPTSGTRQQRQRPDLRPPQAAGALKIALQGAHAVHVPTGALEELDQSTLLLLLLSVLCTSHVQAIPRPCGGIGQSL